MPIYDELRSLNDDVWHPFVRAYADRDAPAFLAIHAPELIRAGGPAREVLDFDAYAGQTRDWFAGMTDRGSSATIEFRFTERLVSGDLASERGVFRITASNAAGDQTTFHGRFHTFCRRSGGSWRIVADYDSNEGGTVDAAAFEAGAAPDDLGPFGTAG